jgi:hypothetical protein
MNYLKYLLILFILINFGFIAVSSYYLKRINELESRINNIEKQVNNPEIKIIPTK